MKFGVSLGLGLLLQVSLSHGLLLGGVEVPKEKMMVYLLIGHSNMAGIDTRNADGVAAANTWSYTWFKDKKWIPAKETPGNSVNGFSGRGEGGLGMPFLKTMIKAFPDYHFGVVSTATVSCTLKGVNTGNNNSGFEADSNRYWKGAKLYNEIVTAAKEVQKDVTLAGVICMLGSVDATRTSEETCRSYSDDAKQMVTDLRADLGAPNLPFLMAEYEAGATGKFALTMPWPAIVDAQIKLIPSKLSLSATINSVGVQMADDHHYTFLVGHQELAKRVVDMIKTKNWMPPPSGNALPVKSGPSVFRGESAQALTLSRAKPGLKIFSVDQDLFGLNGRRLQALMAKP